MIGTAHNAQPGRDVMIDRLSAASARRVIEPDTDVAGQVGPGQLLPDELLSVAGINVELSAEQRAKLAREELAAIVAEGIRFEALLMAGFGMALAQTPQLNDARVTYALHELGEETRRSRLFVRLLDQLGATATSPFNEGIKGIAKRWILRSVIHDPRPLRCGTAADRLSRPRGRQVTDGSAGAARRCPTTSATAAAPRRVNKMV